MDGSYSCRPPSARFKLMHHLTAQVPTMKRIFIALALAFALTGAMVVATVFGHG